MKYGFYQKSEDDETKESKLSTYSERKEKEKYKVSQVEQKLSSQQNNTKGISFGSIKSAGGEASKGAVKSATSAAASKAPSVAVQVIDKAKDGFEKALEYAKSAERPSDPEENSSRAVPGILSVCCLILCLFITVPTLFMPLLPVYSTLLLFTGGLKKTEIVQVPHSWSPYEKNQECVDCKGTGEVYSICVFCQNTGSVPCDICHGDLVSYTVIYNKRSGTVPSEAQIGSGNKYRSYTVFTGCAKCGGGGTRIMYYNTPIASTDYMDITNTVGMTLNDFSFGSGTIVCDTCGGTGQSSKCSSCNGQGVYYHCSNVGCPYNEWNHWESLGVDLDGICFEREVEVTEDD